VTTPPVTLEEYKQHLNLGTLVQQDDAELEFELEAGTDLCEGRVGPIIQRSVSERLTNTGDAITVSEYPLVSVQTVTGVADAPDYQSADLDVDRSGVIRLLAGCILWGRYDVTYTAGWAADAATTPKALKLAVLITASHLHETQRGRQGRPDLMGGEDFTAGGAEQVELIARGYALPRRAIELMSRYERAGGFA